VRHGTVLTRREEMSHDIKMPTAVVCNSHTNTRFEFVLTEDFGGFPQYLKVGWDDTLKQVTIISF
jgi:hypothetical protein